MSILITMLLAIWVLVALLMMLVILMQRPKSEGLGAAFGGAVTENLFGAQTTNVLVKFTAWLAGTFFVVTFALSILYAHRSMAGGSLSRELKKGAAVPLTSPASQPTAGVGKAVPGGSPAGTSPAPDSGVGVIPAGSPAPAASPQTSAAPTISPRSAASVTPKPQ